MTKNDDEYLFSKDLRDSLEPFKDLSPREALSSPDFFNALLKHATNGDDEERKKIWEKVGRPDLAE